MHGRRDDPSNRLTLKSLGVTMSNDTKPVGKTESQKSSNPRAMAVSRVNAEHYRWGYECDAWHLVKDPAFTVIEELIRRARRKCGTITRRHSSFSTFFRARPSWR